MSERPENRGRKDNYLSVAAAEKPSSHRRSTSIGSYTTEVEDDSNLISIDKKPTDKRTKIRLSRLDCLMGVLFPGKANRKVEKTMVTETLDENEYLNNRGSPWIITVNVLSNEKVGSHFVPKAAQCTVDTGNLQGNTVSREFLLNTLKYPESAIERLKDSEKHGGVSTTGDILMPEGACHLTWYHSKSTQVFRGMRFLISPNPRCDLVIGARSIERHNLLSPPNLMARQAIDDPNGMFMEYYSEAHGASSLTMNLDPTYVELNSIQEELQSELKNQKKAVKTAVEDGDSQEEIERLQKKKSDTEAQHKIAQLDIDLYLAKLSFARDKNPAHEAVVKDTEKKLEEAKDTLYKDGSKETVLKEPKNAVTTGRSASDGSAIQRHGK